MRRRGGGGAGGPPRLRLNMQKFDMSQITAGKVVVLIGKRDTGKSFLIRDLLYHQSSIPVGTVVSPTDVVNHFYDSMIPPYFIHHEFSPVIIEKVLKRQNVVMDTMKKEVEATGQSDVDPRAFCILDDCMYDTSWKRDKNMHFLFMNGRHFHLLLILTLQFVLGIPPILRTNVDYIFILRENIVANRRRIYENYAGMFPTFESFCQVMDQCTENFECLVINNNARSNKLKDQVFWYKADTHPQFRLCAPEFWQKYGKYPSAADSGLNSSVNPDEEEIILEENFESSASGKRKGPTISVAKMMAAQQNNNYRGV